MTLIAVGAGKGGPGVTTTTVALAAVWPRAAVVAEVDSAGGDLALRLRDQNGRALAHDHGVLSLATALRLHGDVGLAAHVQTAAGGLELLIGPQTPRQAAALEPLLPALAAHLVSVGDADIFADCGRLAPPTAALHLVTSARLLLLPVRATPEGMAHLRPLLAELTERGLSARVVVVPIAAGRSRTVLDEVTEVVRQIPGYPEPTVLGPLPLDAAGAAGLAGEWTRHLDRTLLVESARQLARDVDALLTTQLLSAG